MLKIRIKRIESEIETLSKYTKPAALMKKTFPKARL